MPPSYVKAYVKRSKNDANDAAAICEAVTRPSMRFVPTKSEQQQSALMLHRSRQLLVRQRTMLSNAIRGHLAELGIISAKGRNGTAELLEIIANEKDDRIPALARLSLAILSRQYAAITAEIGILEKHIHAWHRSCEESRRLEEIPGVGPIVATALIAEVGDWTHSRRAAVSPPGSGWCPDSIRPAARSGSAGFQSRGIDICDGC
jgi:transposase